MALRDDILWTRADLTVVLQHRNLPENAKGYEILLYTNGDHRTNDLNQWPFRGKFILNRDASGVLYANVCISTNRFIPPHTLFVHLYAVLPKYRKLVGYGSTVLTHSSQFNLVDITTNLVGVADLKLRTKIPNVVEQPEMKTQWYNTQWYNHISDKFKSYMVKKHNCTGWKKNTFFAYVKMMNNTFWPLSSWAYLTTRVSASSKSAEFVRRLFQYCHGSTPEERLVDALTMVPRNMMYRDDTVTKDNKQIAVDLWNRLLVDFKNGTSQSFDCDDGATFVMELMHYMQQEANRVLANVIPEDILPLVRSYTPCLTIGGLYDESSGTYSAHVYVTLIHDDVLHRKIHTQGMQHVKNTMLVCESTAWMCASDDSSDDETWYDYFQGYIAPYSHTVWAKALNIRRPVRSYRRVAKYGTVSTLLTGKHYDYDPFHHKRRNYVSHIVLMDKENTVGVSFDDFIDSGASIKYKVYEQFPTDEYHRVCDLPLYSQTTSFIPEVSQVASYMTEPAGFFMELNEKIYNEFREEISGAGLRLIARVHLTNDLSVVRLTV